MAITTQKQTIELLKKGWILRRTRSKGYWKGFEIFIKDERGTYIGSETVSKRIGFALKDKGLLVPVAGREEEHKRDPQYILAEIEN